jgi:hypothetical protein
VVAGFQVSIDGRFWVSTEAVRVGLREFANGSVLDPAAVLFPTTRWRMAHRVQILPVEIPFDRGRIGRPVDCAVSERRDARASRVSDFARDPHDYGNLQKNARAVRTLYGIW